ncbi:MAG: AMP-binding protein, partial [Lysobacterales bacterium]
MTAGREDWGTLEHESEEQQRTAANGDPGAYHGKIAAAELHWHDPKSRCWLNADSQSGEWNGFNSADGTPAGDPPPASWSPWDSAFDDHSAPFFRWFTGATTNACFNEIDRHVLNGKGAHCAFVFEGDRWDPSLNDGQGGPVQQREVSYREFLLETVIRAQVLSNLGLQKGDRVAFNLPSIPEQIFYTEAAKRLGIIYTPVFGGFSAKTLSDRICDAGASVVVTADGGYRNAEVVPFKEIYADPALDNYIPLPAALKALREVLDEHDLGDFTETTSQQVADALRGEITIERSDVMRELGKALSGDRGAQLDPAQTAQIRTDVARRLSGVGHIVKKVVVVRHTGQDIVQQSRDQWSADLVAAATEQVLAKAGEALGDGTATSRESLLALGDTELWRALNASQPAIPVPADWPLFIIYTSGSTGKPKGVVHTHGGWLAGITHTLRTVFNAQADDRIYVIADPGWITGQSYLMAAPFSFGITSIIVEGSPLFPHAGRFSSIIERHGATIFKAGSTFLKAVMTDPASTRDMA